MSEETNIMLALIAEIKSLREAISKHTESFDLHNNILISHYEAVGEFEEYPELN